MADNLLNRLEKCKKAIIVQSLRDNDESKLFSAKLQVKVMFSFMFLVCAFGGITFVFSFKYFETDKVGYQTLNDKFEQSEKERILAKEKFVEQVKRLAKNQEQSKLELEKDKKVYQEQVKQKEQVIKQQNFLIQQRNQEVAKLKASSIMNRRVNTTYRVSKKSGFSARFADGTLIDSGFTKKMESPFDWRYARTPNTPLPPGTNARYANPAPVKSKAKVPVKYKKWIPLPDIKIAPIPEHEIIWSDGSYLPDRTIKVKKTSKRKPLEDVVWHGMDNIPERFRPKVEEVPKPKPLVFAKGMILPVLDLDAILAKNKNPKTLPPPRIVPIPPKSDVHFGAKIVKLTIFEEDK